MCGDSSIFCQGTKFGKKLLLDVVVPADFFEKFGTTCLEYYSLNPMHYYTTPGLVRDAALRMSRVDLQLITDVAHWLKPIVLPFPICIIPAFPPRIASIWTQTICMGGQCHNLCPLLTVSDTCKELKTCPKTCNVRKRCFAM